MANYKFFLPCAGIGSRLKDLTTVKNKALIEVNGKAVIEYILEKIPDDVTIVMALGFRGDEVKEFVETTYPNKTFEFVTIDPFDGPGSGLGYSMLCCKEKLQCPFIFSSNDTIIIEDYPTPDHDWMGHASKRDCAQFRSMRVKNDMIVELCEKGAEGDVFPYIGLAGISSWEFFWKGVSKDDEQFMAIGESASLRRMIESKMPVKAHGFDWYDTGNLDDLARTRKHVK